LTQVVQVVNKEMVPFLAQHGIEMSDTANMIKDRWHKQEKKD